MREPGRHLGLEIHKQDGHVGQKLQEQDWAERFRSREGHRKSIG